MTFSSVLSTSGLTKQELATLYGVSRQTIYAWAGGSAPWPGTPTARLVDTVTAALAQWIASGKLPLRAMDKAARARLVGELATRLQNLKPAPIK